MMTRPGRIPVYILAGGRSSRFGADKARATLAGKPLLQLAADNCAPYARSITVVAERMGQYHDLGLRTIGDLKPGMGPLGGLVTALADLHAPGWLALLACDWAGVRGEWLLPLMRAAGPGVQCVVYAAPQPEPLFALYHSAIAETANRHLGRDQRAMTDLLWAAPHRALAPPPEWLQARNINRREDLRRFERMEGISHA